MDISRRTEILVEIIIIIIIAVVVQHSTMRQKRDPLLAARADEPPGTRAIWFGERPRAPWTGPFEPEPRANGPRPTRRLILSSRSAAVPLHSPGRRNKYCSAAAGRGTAVPDRTCDGRLWLLRRLLFAALPRGMLARIRGPLEVERRAERRPSWPDRRDRRGLLLRSSPTSRTTKRPWRPHHIRRCNRPCRYVGLVFIYYSARRPLEL